MKIAQLKQLLRNYQKGKLNKHDVHLVNSLYDSFGYSEDIPPLNNQNRKGELERNMRYHLEEHIRRSRPIHKLRYWQYASAAVVLISLSFFWFYKASFRSKNPASDFDTIQTEAGQLRKVVFPDSTVVWVNARSVLRYEPATYASNRTVYLDRGEAYFHVSKDPRHPFVVKSPYLSTRVLGTQFNVRTYDELNYASVKVKEGRVRVSPFNHTKPQVITAGQGVIYFKNSGEMQRDDNSLKNAESWVDGNIVLHEVTFKELALTFYNRWHYTLKTKSTEVQEAHYSVNISPNQQPDALLKLISAVHNNHYRRDKYEIEIY